MDTNSNHFQDSGREREERVEMLRKRVGRSDYNLPGETVASTLLSLQVGEMTPEQKELAGEAQRRRNRQAVRRIASERLLMQSPEPSPLEGEIATCPVHKVEYIVVNHCRTLDCDLCFEAEVTRATQRLMEMKERRIEDCQGMSEEAGMRQDAGVVSPPSQMFFDSLQGGIELPKPLARFLPYAVISFFGGVVVAIVWGLTH